MSWTIDSTNGVATNPDKPFFAKRIAGFWRWFSSGRETEYPSQDDVNAVFGGPGVLVGTVLATLRESAPSGYLALDGSTVAAASYPDLAAACPWMVSGADLILPDFRGRFLRGFDDGAGVDPDAASRTARAGDGATGDEVGTVQADAFQGHWHNFRRRDGSSGPDSSWGTASNFGTTETDMVTDPITDGVTVPRTTSETRPKNISVLWLIKT